MFSKIINWFHRKIGWKGGLVILGLALILVAISTGFFWLYLVGAASVAPKALENLTNDDIEAEKKKREIEEEAEVEKKRLEEAEKRRRKQRQKKERHREEDNKKLPEKETPDDLAKKIMEGIDDAGR